MGCAYVDASVCSLMAVYFPDDCLFTRISEHPKPALSKLDQAKDYAYAYTYIHIYIYIHSKTKPSRPLIDFNTS